MACLHRQLLEILRLRAAVTLSKGVDVVHVADHDAGVSCEVIRAQAFQEARLGQTTMNIGHTCLDVAAKLELMATLVDFDRAQFAGPIVDVLEEVTVDGTEMSKVK